MLYISGSFKEEVVEEDDETECIDIKEEIYKNPEVESIAGNSVLLCLISYRCIIKRTVYYFNIWVKSLWFPEQRFIVTIFAKSACGACNIQIKFQN